MKRTYKNCSYHVPINLQFQRLTLTKDVALMVVNVNIGMCDLFSFLCPQLDIPQIMEDIASLAGRVSSSCFYSFIFILFVTSP